MAKISNSMESALRKEYTKYRDIIRKRVQRAEAAGFGNLPNIRGAMSFFKPLKEMSKPDISKLSYMVREARKFIAKPTKVKEIREHLKKVQMVYFQQYRFKWLTLEMTPLFEQFLEEAEDKVRNMVNYYFRVNVKSQLQIEAQIRKNFSEWLAMNAGTKSVRPSSR